MTYAGLKDQILKGHFIETFEKLNVIYEQMEDNNKSRFNELRDELIHGIGKDYKQRLVIFVSSFKDILDIPSHNSPRNKKNDNQLKVYKTDHHIRGERDFISMKLTDKVQEPAKFQSETHNLHTSKKYQEVALGNDQHIIDQIYNSLKRFEGLGFVAPNYIASISPFNILSDYVWHYDKKYRRLFTINYKIYELLEEVNINDTQIALTNKLKQELTESQVIEAEEKLQWIFNFLNHCLIQNITAVKNYQDISNKNVDTIGYSVRHIFNYKPEEVTTKNILVLGGKCDCLNCNYHAFDFDKLINKLQQGVINNTQNNLEYAYGNYLTADNNYITAYNIYKVIEKNLNRELV